MRPVTRKFVASVRFSIAAVLKSSCSELSADTGTMLLGNFSAGSSFFSAVQDQRLTLQSIAKASIFS
jgi:hypothetical protein